MVVLHLRKSQASAKAKYYGFGRKGCSERPRLVLRNIPSRCEQVISYVDDSWIVIYSTSIKTGRRRQTSCDSRDPRPPNYSQLQYSHLLTPRTHNPGELDRHDWANVKREPIAAAFSEDIGDSAVSFLLTGTGKLDHVLIPFARDYILARVNPRPTRRGLFYSTNRHDRLSFPSLPRVERQPSSAAAFELCAAPA